MPKMRSNKYFLFVLAVFIVSFVYLLFTRSTDRSVPDIATFEECAAAGYPIMESYPEQCRTPDGRNFTRVTPTATPSPITISGTYTCLPKKATKGPVTLECAFGLQTAAGYYALDLSAIRSDNYPLLTGNESIIVEGNLVPIEMISSDRFRSYDVLGVIAVEKVTVN